MARAGKSKKNTLRYLIRNYSKIRQACDQVILERLQAEKRNQYSFEWFARLMQGKDPDAKAEQLRHTSRYTEELILALDSAMLIYRNTALQEDLKGWRQFDAMYSRYFSESSSSVNELAFKYGVSKSVIYDDINAAETRLELLIESERSRFSETNANARGFPKYE